MQTLSLSVVDNALYNLLIWKHIYYELDSSLGQNIAVAVLSQGEPWGLAIFHILTKLNSLHTLCRYQCTMVGRMGNRYVPYGRVGKLKTRVGKQKNFFGALR